MSSHYDSNYYTSHNLKEQLRLFSTLKPPQVPPEVTTGSQKFSTKREKLASLLQGDLNFHGENSTYASHDLHAFAAKFPPQLPRTFIRGLTRSGDLVLDPMTGSGTVLVEALLEGRKTIGFDIDPLALRLSQTKCLPLDISLIRELANRVASQAMINLANSVLIENEIERRFNTPTKAFLDYWFLPTTQRELMALVLAIEEIPDTRSRQFLELTLSSIIVTKSGGVSQARDLAHTRPHKVESKVPKNALEQFSIRVRKNLVSIARLKRDGLTSLAIAGDAKGLPLKDSVVDLVVTSPPYANAIDYMRAHKFSLTWLGEPIEKLSTLRAAYIGSERTGSIQYAPLPGGVEDVIQGLSQRDVNRAAMLRRYFAEMRSVLRECFRVLREDSPAIVVVGPSTMRGIDIQTHICLAEIANTVGFNIVGVVGRSLDRNKRMMPARFNKDTESIIERRIHQEFVIGLLKPNRNGG